MELKREFFPKVKKTVMPRPEVRPQTDVLGISGTVRASEATIYGPNWYHDPEQDLIEIWDAGPALCFRDVLPKKDKYAKENLYLKLSLAYRTTENAFVNIRTFSGNHVTLPNAVHGAMYEDPYTFYWVTDDCTININSIYRDERIWIQRVDWEWVSREIIYDDELSYKDPYLYRTKEEVDALYVPKPINDDLVKEFLIKKIKEDHTFAKRCMLLLNGDALLQNDLVTLYQNLGLHSD
ncbi:MAG: hypothetical protein K6U11_01225 [bacterium]|nr:hypothetical protein [bacterium]